MQKLRDDRGVAAVLVAVMSLVIVGMAALVIDMGMLFDTRRQLQNAADFAALSGANLLTDVDAATAEAEKYAVLNGVALGNVTVVTPYDGDPNRIEVTVTTDRTLWFGAIFGETSQTVAARAVALKTSTPGTPGSDGWAIYSGDSNKELVINHDLTLVTGGIHSEGNVVLNGKDITIEGDVEAVGIVIENGENIDAPDQVPGASSESMSDYTARIGLDGPGPDDILDTELAFAAETGCTLADKLELENQGDVDALDSCDAVYANGDILVKAENLTIPFSLLASGAIKFEKQGTVMKDPALDPDNPGDGGRILLVYSSDSLIEIGEYNQAFYATLYAPKDEVKLNNSDDDTNPQVEVFGRIVGDFVTLNGPEITIDTSLIDATNPTAGGSSNTRLTE